MKMSSKKLMSTLERVLLDMTNEREGKVVRIAEAGLIVYQKDDNLYLEWADGHTVCKPIKDIEK